MPLWRVRFKIREIEKKEVGLREISMEEMVEISVVIPRNIKILLPRQLVEEFEERVRRENLDRVVTEALSEELKKIRFRRAWEMVTSRTGPR